MARDKKKVLFRTDLFGFHKKDVLSYLKEYDQTTMEKIISRDTEIQLLKNEIVMLNARIPDLERQQNLLAAERDLIAQTLIVARESADKIINDAKVEAAKKQAEMQQNYTMEINKLATIRNEIIQIRKFATDAIRTFERELSSLEQSTVE
ncbi:MAG: hypothetical protein FWE04_02360 [Oscillospiraceae bacterium]|nr:hypothetical protein [Oscillospiraceae bacterium]